jgi:hypothetical protein
MESSWESPQQNQPPPSTPVITGRLVPVNNNNYRNVTIRGIKLANPGSISPSTSTASTNKSRQSLKAVGVEANHRDRSYSSIQISVNEENISPLTLHSTAQVRNEQEKIPQDGDRIKRSYPYPSSEMVAVPSRNLVECLFHEAMQVQSIASTTTLVANKGDMDQLRVAQTGLLSLERVLLPAVAHAEDAALKKIQAFVQRDGKVCVEKKNPSASSTLRASTELDLEGQKWKDHFVACRKAVYDATSAAMIAVAKNRTEYREPLEKVRVAKEWQPVRDALVEKRKQFAEKQLQTAKSLASKKLPRNQEVWREIAYLMTEQTKLTKEERIWQSARRNLVESREIELKGRESNAGTTRTNKQLLETMLEAELDEGDRCKRMRKENDDLIDHLAQTIEAITLSSIRIQLALGTITQVAAESDAIRNELYLRYCRDYQFRYYPGVHDAPGLLKALSQPTQESDSGN